MNVMLTINKLSLVTWKELRGVEFYYQRSKIATTDNRHHLKPYEEQNTLVKVASGIVRKYVYLFQNKKISDKIF